MAVAAEIPANADGVVYAEGLFVWAGIEGAEVLVERAEGSDAVIGDAQLEMFRQSDGEPQSAFPGERLHGIGVVHLRNCFAEEEARIEENVGVAERRAREGLKFDVGFGDVARERRARGLRLIAAAEVGFVMRRREFEVAEAAEKTFSEKQRAGIAGQRRRKDLRLLR